MIIYQPLCSPTYVDFCECLSTVWNKRNIEKNKHTFVTFVLRFRTERRRTQKIYSISKKGLTHSYNFVIISRFP